MSRVRLQRARYEKQGIIKRHIYEHSALYIMLSIIFITSFVIGSVNAAFIKEELKEESQNYILEFVEYLKTQEIDNKILLRESISANIKPIGYIMLFGLIFVGAPFILIYIGLYSYSIGYTVTSVISTLGIPRGMTFIFTMMLPQELILLPTIFVTAINAILFSKIMMKMNNRNIDVKGELIKYVVIFVIAILITLGVSVFETYVGSNLAKMAIQIIK